jgi:hypothetical protein
MMNIAFGVDSEKLFDKWHPAGMISTNIARKKNLRYVNTNEGTKGMSWSLWFCLLSRKF